ncbi:hypothetical protein NSA50_18555 [Clostridium sp. DSM 100503]|uniref:hypothetical protein n=1 Tax=Clostridium sp. DSM 100503 TaxID=2963282 RepID=UPI002149D6C3|nr:hypothetical protein [Clostridium sp. DSM 100503]MCR1953005.1 hypothetical protein [Clostridium sp. DSM 100503]
MERFFIKSFTVDKVETEELLLRRYSNIDYILSSTYDEGYDFISKAYEKEAEEKLWDIWLINYKYMSKENFESFEDYRNRLKNPSIKNADYSEKLSINQIEEKVKNIIEMTL